MKVFALALALTSTLASAANWQLDNSQSSLHFVSVKNDVVAETHQFKQLSGNWDGNNVVISIAINSLETNIPIRNERIWQYVLHAEKFAAISVSAALAEAETAKLATGQSVVMTMPLNVTIGSETSELSAAVRLTKLSNTSIAASSETPLMLNTNSFKLTAGVAKLQELAGLKRIDPLLPVSFSVQFTQQ
ncbi:YceI family protein [Rheinheimera maricola]|uniref:YceI family protein n=1 Tax=Rheinheimera maricola TaxID=2793282 RepID=A0ABS7XEJ9_9GAMM|nr:YceI family protein [Rheinheimera maricola]